MNDLKSLVEIRRSEGAAGRGGGGKWKHQSTAAARTWLSGSQLSAAEGTAVGCHQDPIHRFTESCLKCGLRQILAQNPFFASAISRKPLSLTNRVGGLAKAEGHHPAILTEWGQVTVTLRTHAIRGLHRNDFIMEAKIDSLVPAP